MNLKISEDLKAKLEAEAEAMDTTQATIIRSLLTAHFNADVDLCIGDPVEMQTTGELSPVNDEAEYRRGVIEACTRMARSSRLGMKTALGTTIGEDIAKHIEQELLGS
jgi:hypothetical protein